jgi:hypothetical protein
MLAFCVGLFAQLPPRTEREGSRLTRGLLAQCLHIRTQPRGRFIRRLSTAVA